MRVLYMHATCVPPPEGSPIDRFELLSENLEGDILHPLWFTKPEEVEAAFGPGSYPVHTVGRFRYHWILEGKERGIRSRMTAAYHYLRKGVQIHREKPFDCIVWPPSFRMSSSASWAGIREPRNSRAGPRDRLRSNS
jgi:hypothetical protein